jgi:uncharacterized membrane protein YbhN (UPF0104 family)
VTSSPTSRMAWVLRAVKLVVIALVAWGLWRTVAAAWDDFARAGVAWTDFHIGWLALAAVFYLLGQLPAGIFWYATLRAMGQQPGLGETLRAYYIGHLGKYVPGKAMVVVLRAGMVQSDRVNVTIAATSVFVETLTMMAVGGFLAAVILLAWASHHWQLMLLAVGLLVASGLPTLPPVFRFLVRMLQVTRAGPHVERAIEGLSWRLILMGWGGNVVGWLLMGLSLWATLVGLPGTEGTLGDLVRLMPLLTAAVALAVVAGFLSMLPGGIGVRELVLIPIMTTLGFGSVTAVLAAVALRIVWLAGEVVLSAALYFCPRSQWAAEPAVEPPRDRREPMAR